MSHHIYLECSNCSRKIADVWVTRKDDHVTPVAATCPFCNDRSFIHEIQGSFVYGGYSRPKMDDENDCVRITNVSDADTVLIGEQEVLLIKTSVAK